MAHWLDTRSPTADVHCSESGGGAIPDPSLNGIEWVGGLTTPPVLVKYFNIVLSG